MAETRGFRFSAEWSEDLKAGETFELGDLVEVEGHDLTVVRVSLIAPPDEPKHVHVDMTDAPTPLDLSRIEEARRERA